MSDLETQGAKSEINQWWRERTALEKVGTVAVGAAGVAAVAVLVAPGLVSSAVGGALGGAGAWLLGRGLRR